MAVLMRRTEVRVRRAVVFITSAGELVILCVYGRMDLLSSKVTLYGWFTVWSLSCAAPLYEATDRPF